MAKRKAVVVSDATIEALQQAAEQEAAVNTNEESTMTATVAVTATPIDIEEQLRATINSVSVFAPSAVDAAIKALLRTQSKELRKQEGHKYPRVKTNREWVKTVEEHLVAGDMTRAELVNEVAKWWPTVNRSTVATFITDQRNVKYTRFRRVGGAPRVAIINGQGKLQFEDLVIGGNQAAAE